MRKIDKSLILATQYKAWLDTLKTKNKKHTIYSSSNGKYYYDIVANLIWVQSGICAYTEKLLHDHSGFAPEYWVLGAFPKTPKYAFCGELDHYDPSLKDQFGWDWANFFIVDADVNKKVKRSNMPMGLLKPDLPQYNPKIYLEYDRENHLFIPNKLLKNAIQDQVRKDLEFLGVNFPPIIYSRKKYLEPLLFDVEYQLESRVIVESKLYQFFTAFDMVADTL
ncbi:hypothetical protein ACE38W_01695 [Chitinophaga sp. Hz27]|uniref:hypothetical protein n=1 Tax=Chitinophaga sp. Hz27 TaxID=3347169 RepID=UPI0035E18691